MGVAAHEVQANATGNYEDRREWYKCACHHFSALACVVCVRVCVRVCVCVGGGGGLWGEGGGDTHVRMP